MDNSRIFRIKKAKLSGYFFLYEHEHTGRFSNLHQCTFKMMRFSFCSKLLWGSYIVPIAKNASKKIGYFIRLTEFPSSVVGHYLSKSTMRLCMKSYCHVWDGVGILLPCMGWCFQLLWDMLNKLAVFKKYVIQKMKSPSPLYHLIKNDKLWHKTKEDFSNIWLPRHITLNQRRQKKAKITVLTYMLTHIYTHTHACTNKSCLENG